MAKDRLSYHLDHVDYVMGGVEWSGVVQSGEVEEWSVVG